MSSELASFEKMQERASNSKGNLKGTKQNDAKSSKDNPKKMTKLRQQTVVTIVARVDIDHERANLRSKQG